MNLINKKSILLSALVLAALGGATLYVIHKELAGQDIPGILKNAEIPWILAALAAMALYALCDGINIRRCLALAGCRIGFAQMMKYAFAGFFFSSITPSSTGGQPAQLYFMAKDRLKISQSAFTLLCAMLSFQTAEVVLGIIGVLSTGGKVFGLKGTFGFIFPIGFSLNIAIIIFLFCVLFSRRTSAFFTRIGLWFVKKRGGQNKEKNSLLRSFASYRKAAFLMRKNKSVLIKMFATSLVQIMLYHSVTFFCARAIGCSDLGWFAVLRTQSSLFLSVSSLPLPGAAGVTEYGYALFYADLIPSELLGSVMLLSRFCAFVLPLIVSGLCLLLLSAGRRDSSSEIS
ncbi:MAG: flippase-like domain-containing protein [Lachnospiraceae bacterium]|nr:flippase-like domain-containing protein [Lachnospiraceae bacterium]